VQTDTHQRDLETALAYVLASGVGYSIALFGDLLQARAYENGAFAVAEVILLTDGRGGAIEVDAQPIFDAAVGAIHVFEDRVKKKTFDELHIEVTFASAREAVAFFEQRRRARLLGWDYETEGGSLHREDIRDLLGPRQADV
jgi:hypothetical protein